jgi:hypothetical protein
MSKPRKGRGGHMDPPDSPQPSPARSIDDVVIEIKRLSKSSVKEEIAPFIATAKEAIAEIEARLA